MVQNFQCPFPIHNILRQRHGRGAVPPEAALQGRGGGHFSTTAAPRTAVRGILDSPGGGASAVPMGALGEALLGVIPILECERAEIGRRRPMRATKRYELRTNRPYRPHRPLIGHGKTSAKLHEEIRARRELEAFPVCNY